MCIYSAWMAGVVQIQRQSPRELGGAVNLDLVNNIITENCQPNLSSRYLSQDMKGAFPREFQVWVIPFSELNRCSIGKYNEYNSKGGIPSNQKTMSTR
jgi:hypothetical protein